MDLCLWLFALTESWGKQGQWGSDFKPGVAELDWTGFGPLRPGLREYKKDNWPLGW